MKQIRPPKKGSSEELVGGFAAGALPQTPGFSALARSKMACDTVQDEGDRSIDLDLASSPDRCSSWFPPELYPPTRDRYLTGLKNVWV